MLNQKTVSFDAQSLKILAFPFFCVQAVWNSALDSVSVAQRYICQVCGRSDKYSEGISTELRTEFSEFSGFACSVVHSVLISMIQGPETQQKSNSLRTDVKEEITVYIEHMFEQQKNSQRRQKRRSIK